MRNAARPRRRCSCGRIVGGKLYILLVLVGIVQTTTLSSYYSTSLIRYSSTTILAECQQAFAPESIRDALAGRTALSRLACSYSAKPSDLDLTERSKPYWCVSLILLKSYSSATPREWFKLAQFVQAIVSPTSESTIT